jgi:hypothetical protein
MTRFFLTFVGNPGSGATYRVAIRGSGPGDNYCSCPDFATNTLGTCKHVEFVLRKIGSRPRTRKLLRGGFQPPYSEIVQQYGAKRDVRFRPGTACPRRLTALAATYFDSEHLLRAGAFATFESFLSKAAKFDHDLRCYDDVLGFVAEVRDQLRREQTVAKAFPEDVHDSRFRGLIEGELYEYQREGALFAARAGRCLLADEMGLGKTIQALAASEIMAREFGVERVLIVCPTSLKHQWEREISKFTRRRTQVVGGLRAERERQYAARGSFFTIVNYDRRVGRRVVLPLATAPRSGCPLQAPHRRSRRTAPGQSPSFPVLAGDESSAGRGRPDGLDPARRHPSAAT